MTDILCDLDSIMLIPDKPKIEHEYTHEMVCPHCGYVGGDDWEFEDGEGQRDCGRCDEPFDYERIVTVVYSTSKKVPSQ